MGVILCWLSFSFANIQYSCRQQYNLKVNNVPCPKYCFSVCAENLIGLKTNVSTRSKNWWAAVYSITFFFVCVYKIFVFTCSFPLKITYAYEFFFYRRPVFVAQVCDMFSFKIKLRLCIYAVLMVRKLLIATTVFRFKIVYIYQANNDTNWAAPCLVESLCDPCFCIPG